MADVSHSKKTLWEIDRQLVVDCLRHLSGTEPGGLVDDVVACARPLHLKRGDTLFRQGEAGDELYLVMRGRLRILRYEPDSEPRQVNEVGRFETIGEIALVTRHSRTATVIAVRDSLLLRISRADYQELAAGWPDFALRLSNKVVGRLVASALLTPSRNRGAKIYAVMSTHAGIDLDHFHRELCRCLEEHGPTLSVDEQNIDHFLRERGLSSLADRRAPALLASWIDELEGRFRFVICKGGQAGSRWARHCCRYADHMVLVGDTDNRRTEAALALPLFQGTRPECDFVRLHEGALNSVADMQGILGLGLFARHHHLCRGDAGGIKRISRFLAGEAVGLVLAGGGARGLAHIGVVRAMREAGIPIDFVGGTSSGAIIGAFVAMGLDDADLIETAKKVFVHERPLRDYTVPVYSLIKGERIDELLQEHTQGRSIEDLWLNYFCVSASLTSNECVVHDNGSIWQAIRASIALPGILPPVIRDRHMLVDGGMINNLPVDVMAAKGVGRTIAVDLAGGAEALHIDADGLPSVSELIGRKLLRRGDAEAHEDIPGIFEILYRASLVGSSRQSDQNRLIADLYLNLPVDHIGLLEFGEFDKIVEAGYQHAVQALAKSELANEWIDRTAPGVALGVAGAC
jgi:predicted acylesterase/phospholipase RssA